MQPSIFTGSPSFTAPTFLKLLPVCVEVLDGVASKLDSKSKKSVVSIEEAIADYCKCSAPGQCQNADLTLRQNKMVSAQLVFCVSTLCVGSCML